MGKHLWLGMGGIGFEREKWIGKHGPTIVEQIMARATMGGVKSGLRSLGPYRGQRAIGRDRVGAAVVCSVNCP